VDSLIALLQNLIQIPSVNPDGDPGFSPQGELEMAKALTPFLQSMGMKVILEEVEKDRPNLIAKAPGREDRPRILLGPHLDTVGVSAMTIDPFKGSIANGKIYGRGASDTKGPMAAMLWALKTHAHRLADLPVAIDFVAFMGEESLQPGSRHFAKHHAKDYQFAIAGEPTSLEVVFCTKGCLWTTLSTKGKATHASQPHLGKNAISDLIEKLSHLENEFGEQISQKNHPILGRSTLNIGTITGGTRPNIVPDHASAQIDIRTIPSLLETKSAFGLLESFFGSSVTLSNTIESPPMETSLDNPWLQKLKEFFPEQIFTGAPWFSDAAHLANAGLASVCLGPGSIDQAHTADEFIRIRDLEAGADWFSAFIDKLI